MKFEKHGADHGPKILCIPGTFMDSSCFLPLIRELPDCQFICVTLDAHHEGGSQFTTLDHEVGKMVHLLKEHGWTKFDMVLGLSMGTIVSLELAARPEMQIDRLVLDGAVNLYTSKNQKIECFTTLFFLSFFQGRLKKGKKKASNKDVQTSEQEWMRSWQTAASCVSRQSLRNIVNELVYYKPTPGLEQPIYLLYGSKEANHEACYKAACSCFPHVRVKVKKGYNHLTWLEKDPKEYAHMLQSVLRH